MGIAGRPAARHHAAQQCDVVLGEGLDIMAGGAAVRTSARHYLKRGRTLAVSLEFVKDPEIGHFGGLGGPGGSGNPPKRCRASPRTFWKGVPGPQGRPDPQNGRFLGP